jgi:hypothetical protein
MRRRPVWRSFEQKGNRLGEVYARKSRQRIGASGQSCIADPQLLAEL